MSNSFQYAQLIRDHLTQEPLRGGHPHISEVSLYSQYLRHQSADNRFFSDRTGRAPLISARDKQLIGSIILCPGGMDALAAENVPPARIDGGQIRLYEHIPGTDWYLVEEMKVPRAFSTLNLVRNGAHSGLCAAALILAGASLRLPADSPPHHPALQASLGRVMEGPPGAHRHTPKVTNSAVFREALQRWWSRSPPLLESVKREEQEKHLAELDFLQAQINPPLPSTITPSSIRFPAGDGQGTGGGEMVFYFSAAAGPLSPARWSSSPWGRSWTR